MDFQWGQRDPDTGDHLQITGIPSYYGVDSNGVDDFLEDGDIINVNSKLFKFEMSVDGGYIGSRYRVHNDRNDIDYAKDVLLSATEPVVVDIETSTQAQDTYHTSFEINNLPNV